MSDSPQQPQPVDRDSLPNAQVDGVNASYSLFIMPFAGDE